MDESCGLEMKEGVWTTTVHTCRCVISVDVNQGSQVYER